MNNFEDGVFVYKTFMGSAAHRVFVLFLPSDIPGDDTKRREGNPPETKAGTMIVPATEASHPTHGLIVHSAADVRSNARRLRAA